MARNKDRIVALLKSIETGEPGPISVVNEARYIQHNPQTHEGSEGLAALFQRLAKTSPRVNVVRIFEDGDFVFGHTEYDFATRRIGFELFRFDGGQAVEHWDNIQPRLGPNASVRSMVDGPVVAQDLDQTEANRALVRTFVEEVLIAKNFQQLDEFLTVDTFIEHNPRSEDGVDAVKTLLTEKRDGRRVVDYRKLHRVVAEGNFVLSVCEGYLRGQHSALFDLYRIEVGRIAEHWDTVEKIAPQSEWKNQNGKF